MQLNSPPVLVKNNFTENAARYGGGAYINDVPLSTSEENVWHGNIARAEGGCISVQSVSKALFYHEAFSA